MAPQHSLGQAGLQPRQRGLTDSSSICGVSSSPPGPGPVLTWADIDVRLRKGLCGEEGQDGRGPQSPPLHPGPRESHLTA